MLPTSVGASVTPNVLDSTPEPSNMESDVLPLLSSTPSGTTKEQPPHHMPVATPPSKSPTPSKGAYLKSPSPSSGNINSGSEDNGTKPGTNQDVGGLPLGVGGTSAVAIISFIALLVVIVAAYKTCAIVPSNVFVIPSIFGSSDDENGGDESEFDFGSGSGDDSPWDQVWQDASDLSEGAQREGEAAAAQVGGQFAGLLKPGSSRVRPPQVITRLAIPGMFTTLSQLSPDSGSSVMSVTTGFSYEPFSQEASDVESDVAAVGAPGGSTAYTKKEKLALDVLAGAVEAPKADILFVFDASGSLSWRDYRRVKEIITKPRGLIDEFARRMHDASRIGFIEYAYDSVVVSELDRDKDSVRRRILSSFQGDANNWDQEGMYIYEVGSADGGNVLRKVSSVVDKRICDEPPTRAFHRPNEPESVKVKEVPPAMNGMSREAHLALKWSRFEMLPPVANKRIQAQLQNYVRRRRVILVSGGEFTKGGHTNGGVAAAVIERKEMERNGIRVVTIGIGTECEQELAKVATRKRDITLASVDEFEGAIERIGELVMAPDTKGDGLLKLPHMPFAFKWWSKENEDDDTPNFDPNGRTTAYEADPVKTISEGLPRRASELPPWYTDGVE